MTPIIYVTSHNMWRATRHTWQWCFVITILMKPLMCSNKQQEDSECYLKQSIFRASTAWLLLYCRHCWESAIYLNGLSTKYFKQDVNMYFYLKVYLQSNTTQQNVRMFIIWYGLMMTKHNEAFDHLSLNPNDFDIADWILLQIAFFVNVNIYDMIELTFLIILLSLSNTASVLIENIPLFWIHDRWCWSHSLTQWWPILSMQHRVHAKCYTSLS